MNPSFFLKVFNGKLVLWNYATHEQYELDIDHVHRIVELAAEPGYRANAMDRAIRDSGCLDEIDPPDWGWDCLSRIFHVGTQIRLKEGESLPVEDGYEGYVRYCASIADRMPALVTERPGAVTPLPPPNLDALATVNLRDALMQRESCRNFSAEPLTLQMVSDILWATFGAVHGTTREDMVQAGMMPVGYRRTSPSQDRCKRAKRTSSHCVFRIYPLASITIVATRTNCPWFAKRSTTSILVHCCAPRCSRTTSHSEHS